jgi:4-hydroxyphenylpyruvate dioxygenase-like putative hemolysin
MLRHYYLAEATFLMGLAARVEKAAQAAEDAQATRAKVKALRLDAMLLHMRAVNARSYAVVCSTDEEEEE